MYGKYSTSPSNIIERELTEKRKPVLCNPCIGLPMKFRSEKKPNSPEVTAVVEEKFYGSMESICWNNSDERNGENKRLKIILVSQTPEDESQLSSTSMETGTTVISVDRSVNGNSSNRDDLCESSLCLETFFSASKCFTPPSEQFRAGGDCLNSSVAGNFRYLESENNSPDKFAQYRADTGANQESSDSNFMVHGKRRKSEIFHISFHSDRKKELSKEKSNSPSVFKVL
ncbi:hypothetical protein LSTR_LSTR009560 [Laodelphax striatellus]|uniref:Uncharacterized protein n=1 Tax=Laodelphax striatellus TaxID=195883 RepID=A0A482WSD8_LAOST|nr:hypothetical protein LSTR_LSTR009560 [Laodelphax striatellus]